MNEYLGWHINISCWVSATFKLRYILKLAMVALQKFSRSIREVASISIIVFF